MRKRFFCDCCDNLKVIDNKVNMMRNSQENIKKIWLNHGWENSVMNKCLSEKRNQEMVKKQHKQSVKTFGDKNTWSEHEIVKTEKWTRQGSVLECLTNYKNHQLWIRDKHKTNLNVDFWVNENDSFDSKL